MAQKNRIELIERALLQDRSVSVSGLSGRFGVTEETIRRDLEKLEKRGIATRTYGGAVLNPDYLNQNSIHFNQRAQINLKEKRIIAEKAVQLMAKETTIGFDSSSTAMEIVRHMGDGAGKTLVTNSVEVLLETSQSSINVLSTGGFLNRKSMSLYGVAAQNTIQHYHMDIAFLGCKALSMTSGIFDSNEYETLIKNAMVAQSQKVVLVADHTKFDRISFVRLMGFEKLHALVTDEQPSQDWCTFLADHHIELIC